MQHPASSCTDKTARDSGTDAAVGGRGKRRVCECSPEGGAVIRCLLDFPFPPFDPSNGLRLRKWTLQNVDSALGHKHLRCQIVPKQTTYVIMKSCDRVWSVILGYAPRCLTGTRHFLNARLCFHHQKSEKPQIFGVVPRCERLLRKNMG